MTTPLNPDAGAQAQEAPVFEVKFRCSNCGYCWAQNFARGYDVLTSNLLGTRVLHDLHPTRQVYCPHCNSRHVFITQRTPIPTDPESKRRATARGGHDDDGLEPLCTLG